MLITSYDAANYIKSHDHEVFTTPDGIVAKTGVMWGLNLSPNGNDDRYMEELEVFPVDDNGMVDLRPIKAWLGY